MTGVFDSALYRKLVVNDRIAWHGFIQHSLYRDGYTWENRESVSDL